MMRLLCWLRDLPFSIAFLSIGPVFLSSGAWGQVPAHITFDRETPDSVRQLRVTWSASDEALWRDANEDRLDMMGIKLGLTSDILTASSSTRFRLGFDISIRAEFLVDFTFRKEGERLYFMDRTTGDVIFDFMKTSGFHCLSTAIWPENSILVWQGIDGEPRQSRFTIRNVYIEPTPNRQLDIGFGTALACHPNAACKPDSISQFISKSVVRMRMVMEEGIGWCTGSFVNNARQDHTPYILSAYHCQYNYTPLYDMWRFDLEYASSTCDNPSTEPVALSLTGCSLMSGGQASDFLLVRLTDALPVNLDITFAGWDRDEALIPDTVFHVHHPNADIRKFSTCTNGIVIHPNTIGWSEGYTTPANHHLRFKFTEGGHEPGSSGGPIFNSDGYIVAQLHGGTAGCEIVNSTFAGRLSRSWELGATAQERLQDWLDPDQSGLVRLAGIENAPASELIDVEGIVLDPAGRPVRNVMVRVQGSVEDTMITGTDGRFTLTDIHRNGEYIFTPSKNVQPLNGINALDIVGIQKHLLAKDTFDFAWQHIAADPTNGGTITVGDMVMIQKLLLGQTQAFPTSPSWRFSPPSVTISQLPAGQSFQLEMTGIKIGDVNGTANPQQ